jgi:hypothetical protein
MDMATGRAERVCRNLLLGKGSLGTQEVFGGSADRLLVLAECGGYSELLLVDVGECSQTRIAGRALFDDPLKWRPTTGDEGGS